MQAWITKFELRLNGEKVSHWPENPLLGPTASWNVMYDSTFFVAGTTIPWKVYVEYALMDWEGTTHVDQLEHTVTVPIKNRIQLAVHPDAPLLVGPAVWQHMQPPHFTQGELIGSSWTPSDFTNSLENASVVCLATHGSGATLSAAKDWQFGEDIFTTYIHPDGNDQDVPGHQGCNQHSGVLPHRVQQIGIPLYGPHPLSTLPPYNITGQPPVTFAFAIACCAGSESLFYSAFCFPCKNAYGEYNTNQAYAGFGVNIYLGDFTEIANTVFSSLVSGLVVRQARDAVINHNPPFYTSTTNPPRQLTSADMPIWGDWNTRVRSVYTYDSRTPVWFYRKQ